MYQSLAGKAFHRIFTVTLLLLSSVHNIFAAELTIEEASQLALKDDYTLRAFGARSESLTELAIATGRLPDPKLKLGFANLPTDSFNLGQEPMTQAVIGVQQMFPRGQTRSFNSDELTSLLHAMMQRLKTGNCRFCSPCGKNTSRIFLHQERQRILEQSLVVFTDLAEITRDYYANGRAHQQDVVHAQLELSKVKERLALNSATGRAGARQAGGADRRRMLTASLVPTWPQV